MHDAEQSVQAIIDWKTVQRHPSAPTLLGDPQHAIEIHWYSAQTSAGITVDFFVTNPQHPPLYYQNLPDPIDPTGNCHGETFGPVDPHGKRYNIHEGSVHDILQEGFRQLHSTERVRVGDVVVWMEPNRTAAHSALAATVKFAPDGQLDPHQTMLWTKNGLNPAGTMALAEVHSYYLESEILPGVKVATTLEFWRSLANP